MWDVRKQNNRQTYVKLYTRPEHDV